MRKFIIDKNTNVVKFETMIDYVVNENEFMVETDDISGLIFPGVILVPCDEEIKELRKQAYSIEVDYLILQYNRHLITNTGLDLTQLKNEIENKTNEIKERYPYNIDNPIFKIKNLT